MKTNRKKTSLQKAAENFNAMLLRISERQMEDDTVSCKELSELAKALLQAIEIGKAMDPKEEEAPTVQIIMEREDYML